MSHSITWLINLSHQNLLHFPINPKNNFKMHLKIVPVEIPKDIPELVDLANKSFLGDLENEKNKFGWSMPTPFITGKRITPAILQDDLSTPRMKMFKCVDNGNRIVGCVTCQQVGKEMHSGLLSVLPEMQGRGIGKLLMEKAEAYSKEAGASSILIEVFTFRDSVIKWYERRGFVSTGKTVPIPRKEERAWVPLRENSEFLVMEKTLK